ncbi:DUF6279 family lipoprotein [Bowmanella denitrificans]|uniref:DUF6279 family lipoprotein n=1 Tax=Bowmanella denitrificans TaxID=366582 RepID=A0ABN0WWZ9_9ALTE
MVRIFAALLLVLTLSGCSTTFVYNNLDWLVHWYIDDYVELNKEQKKQFDHKMQDWLKWHRHQQLPRYRDDLVALKQQFEQGQMTQAQWQEFFSRVRGHWYSLINHLGPDLAELSLQLNDQQIKDMFAAFEKQQKEREEERNELDEQERLEKSRENLHEDMQEWTGRLSAEQKAQLNEWVEGFAPTYELRLKYRRNWQQAAMDSLLGRVDTKAWRDTFTLLLVRPQDYQSDALREADLANREYYARMLAELTPGLSDKQKRHVLREMQQRIDDLNDLIEH